MGPFVLEVVEVALEVRRGKETVGAIIALRLQYISMGLRLGGE